jgi:hypothetical protein
VLEPDEFIGYLQYAAKFKRKGKGEVGIQVNSTMPALIE